MPTNARSHLPDWDRNSLSLTSSLATFWNNCWLNASFHSVATSLVQRHVKRGGLYNWLVAQLGWRLILSGWEIWPGSLLASKIRRNQAATLEHLSVCFKSFCSAFSRKSQGLSFRVLHLPQPFQDAITDLQHSDGIQFLKFLCEIEAHALHENKWNTTHVPSTTLNKINCLF